MTVLALPHPRQTISDTLYLHYRMSEESRIKDLTPKVQAFWEQFCQEQGLKLVKVIGHYAPFGCNRGLVFIWHPIISRKACPLFRIGYSNGAARILGDHSQLSFKIGLALAQILQTNIISHSRNYLEWRGGIQYISLDRCFQVTSLVVIQVTGGSPIN